MAVEIANLEVNIVWDENMLKRCMEENLELVFGQEVIILDLDTVNTIAGRPDTVLLNRNGQLIVVEWESVLTSGNIGHALLDQAWDCAKHYYLEMSHDDIPKLHRRYMDYRFPGEAIPDLHTVLGIDRDVPLWDHNKPLIVVVGAWKVQASVYSDAKQLVQDTYSDEKHKVPCEVWIYHIQGQADAKNRIAIADCKRTLVFRAEGKPETHLKRSGLHISNQHTSARLSSEFRDVALLMEAHVSKELKPYLDEFHSKVRWQKNLLKWSPWGKEKEICFEFSRINSQDNPIKGAHCQLYVRGRKALEERLRDYLRSEWPSIAKDLKCSTDDLWWTGHSYPIKQHRVDDSSPEDIAKVFGRFCSVIYRRVDLAIREELNKS